LHGTDATELAQACRLQQDHGWIDANWNEVAPMPESAIPNRVGFEPSALAHAIDLFVPLYGEHLLREEAMQCPQAQAALKA
jgi:hypothetical protein